MKSDHPHPIVVPRESGKVLKFLGVTHKLTPQQTDSGYYLFEFEFDPESGNNSVGAYFARTCFLGVALRALLYQLDVVHVPHLVTGLPCASPRVLIK